MRAAVFSVSAVVLLAKRTIPLAQKEKRNRQAGHEHREQPAEGGRQSRVPLRPPLEPDQLADRLREDRLAHAHAPQLLREVQRRLVAAVAVLLERGLDDDLQIRGDRRGSAARRSGGSFVRIAW